MGENSHKNFAVKKTMIDLPCDSKHGSGSRPAVALVRGPRLAASEMQTYELLAERYRFMAFALDRPQSNVAGLKIPYEKLDWIDSLRGRSLLNAYYARVRGQRYFMPGLERRLADFDVVHSQECQNMFSWQVARAKEKHGFKMVLTVAENIPHPAWHEPEIRERKEAVIAAADMFLALTTESHRVLRLEGIEPPRIRVIPYGVDLERFRPGPPSQLWLERAGIEKSNFIVLFVGRLVWEKGVFDLLNAIKMIESRHVCALIVGDGAERDSLREYTKMLGLEHRVRFLPFLPYDDIEQVHRLANVLVLPSLPTHGVREQFGMVLIEAMACGIPVIATRCGSMPGVIEDSGLLANPGDAGSLVDALQQLVASPDLCKQLGSKGRVLAERKYDRRKTVEMIDEAYHDVLKM